MLVQYHLHPLPFPIGHVPHSVIFSTSIPFSLTAGWLPPALSLISFVSRSSAVSVIKAGRCVTIDREADALASAKRVLTPLLILYNSSTVEDMVSPSSYTPT